MTKQERKAKNEARKTNSCVCGCGTKVRGHFAQGHDQRFRGYLQRVEAGKATAKEQAAVKAAKSLLLAKGVLQPNAPVLRQAA